MDEPQTQADEAESNTVDMRKSKVSSPAAGDSSTNYILDSSEQGTQLEDSDIDPNRYMDD